MQDRDERLGVEVDQWSIERHDQAGAQGGARAEQAPSDGVHEDARQRPDRRLDGVDRLHARAHRHEQEREKVGVERRLPEHLVAARERPGRDRRRHPEIVGAVDQRNIEVRHVPDLQDVHDPDGVREQEYEDSPRIHHAAQEIHRPVPDRGGGRGRVVAHTRSRGESEMVGTRMARLEIATPRPRPPPLPEDAARLNLSAAVVPFPWKPGNVTGDGSIGGR